MANPAITNNDSSPLPVFSPVYKQDVVRFGAAETRPIGEVLARKHISDTVAAAAGTNTGNGTLTSPALAAGGPAKVGAYAVTCVEAITNGGRFALIDPDGNILDNQIIILAGAGGVVAFSGHGLSFILTDAGTDFAVDDTFSLTTTVDGI